MTTRDLSTIDRDIGQDWSRIIQEAFEKGPELSCDMFYGKRLADRPEQGIYAASAIQNYDIGTRRVTPDGRVYRYGKCYQTLTTMNVGVKNYRCLVTVKDNVCKAASAGATTLDVATDAFTLGENALTKDLLRGGYISLYRDADRQQRFITGNTAVATLAGGIVTLTLKDPLVTAIKGNDNIEIMANPYDQLLIDNHNYTAVMGMPTRLALAGEYFWIQTWGPCRISPEGVGYPAEENQLQYVFGSTGGIITVAEADALGYAKQLAGFVINRAADGIGAEHCAPFIMLQISP